MEAHANVLDTVIVRTTATTSTQTPRCTVARLWPLDVVDAQFCALDDASLATLGHNASSMPFAMPSLMPSPQRRASARSRRKSTTPNRPARPARRSEARTAGGTPDAAAPRAVPCVNIVAAADEIAEARKVLLVSSGLTDVLGSDQFVDHVHSLLVGRALMVGMVVPISALGTSCNLQVSKIDATTTLAKPTCEPKPEKEDHNAIAHKKEQEPKQPFTFVSSTILDISPPPTSPITGEEEAQSAKQAPLLESIGGLHAQIVQLKDLLQTALCPTDEAPDLVVNSKQIRTTPQGALLYGIPGTGKTLLACALAEWSEAHVEWLSGSELAGQYSGEAVRKVETTFRRARRKAPAVIILDDVEVMAPRRDAGGTDNVQRKTTAALLALLDGHDGRHLQRVFILATTSRRDAIDGAMRRAGRLDVELELGIPDATARAQILQALAGPSRLSKADWPELGERCRGFVGADLHAVQREAVGSTVRAGRDATTRADWDAAVRRTRPSGLRDLVVEIPDTRWTDIGGQEHVKARLREAVEWPLHKSCSKMLGKLDVGMARGILLFGPPGCSKTLLARAVATECGANFVGVKGGELLSKWVGDSEKAVRELYRKARDAAPCVVFLDEVDALAGRREASGEGGGGGAQARVVAQLLHELDGLDSAVGQGMEQRVVTIAATNRPDCLDAAFVRPGRMDLQLHVGLPDERGRLLVLQVHCRDVPLAADVDVARLAGDEWSGGLSGAEVAALVREAGLCAMERDVAGARLVDMSDFEHARGKVVARTPREVLDYFDRYVRALVTKGLSPDG